VAGEAILERPLSALLQDVAARTPAPGGGSVAAIAVALAASLVGMAARFSDSSWPAAAEVAARADELRARAGPLAQADADAYSRVLAAYRLPRSEDGSRDEAVARALEEAASVPLEVAGLAAEVARLAAQAVREGNPNLRGDGATGASLAAAAAGAAATLVEINLAHTPRDDRITRARVLAVEAAGHAEAAAAGATA
jgi:formiminotetrahydrofolate cyclodeaminase